eukprot:scaffold5278_cov128-Amphora_coffeaeformis.AAC.5
MDRRDSSSDHHQPAVKRAGLDAFAAWKNHGTWNYCPYCIVVQTRSKKPKPNKQTKKALHTAAVWEEKCGQTTKKPYPSSTTALHDSLICVKHTKKDVDPVYSREMVAMFAFLLLALKRLAWCVEMRTRVRKKSNGCGGGSL